MTGFGAPSRGASTTSEELAVGNDPSMACIAHVRVPAVQDVGNIPLISRTQSELASPSLSPKSSTAPDRVTSEAGALHGLPCGASQARIAKDSAADEWLRCPKPSINPQRVRNKRDDRLR